MAVRERIRGKLGDDMVEAAMLAFMPDMWAGNAGQIGLNQPRSCWRGDMRRALEAAFEALLKEPTA